MLTSVSLPLYSKSKFTTPFLHSAATLPLQVLMCCSSPSLVLFPLEFFRCHCWSHNCHSFLCPKSQLYPAESFLALSAGLLPRTDTNFFVLYYFFWKVRLITIKVVVEIEGKKKKNSEFKKPEPRVQKRLLIPLKSSSRPYY